MSERPTSFSPALMKWGMLVVAVAAILLAVMGWIVGDSWSLQGYASDSVAHDGVAGVSRDGDQLVQGFRSGCDIIDRIDLDIAQVGDHASGTVTAEVLEGDRLLISADFDLGESVQDGVLTLLFPDNTCRTTLKAWLTLRLTLNDPAQDDHLPALWIGSSIDAGRFSVDADNLDSLTLNGTPLHGQLCMTVNGHTRSDIMAWYWPICGVVAALMALIVLVTARRKALGKRGLLLTLIELCQRYSFLMEQLVGRDFNTKYRQSLLGVVWSFLNPLLTMSVQYVVFSTIFKSSIPNFPVYLITGIILFNFFSEAVSLGLDSIVVNGPLITKVYMPKYIYPISRSVSSLINLLISFVPLVALMLVTGVPLTKAFLLSPLVVLFVFTFALGMALILCTLNVFFRDVKFLWGVVVLLWTYATPIFYPETIIPARFLPLYHLNPMYQFIYFLRCITLDGITPAPITYLYCILASLVPLLIGLYVFRRNQDRFVFYL